METEEEWQFIYEEIQKRCSVGWWNIGLNKVGPTWKWVTGKPLTILRWQENQPSGDGSWTSMSKRQGLFNDHPENAQLSFICEMPRGKTIRQASKIKDRARSTNMSCQNWCWEVFYQTCWKFHQLNTKNCSLEEALDTRFNNHIFWQILKSNFLQLWLVWKEIYIKKLVETFPYDINNPEWRQNLASRWNTFLLFHVFYHWLGIRYFCLRLVIHCSNQAYSSERKVIVTCMVDLHTKPFLKVFSGSIHFGSRKSRWIICFVPLD